MRTAFLASLALTTGLVAAALPANAAELVLINGKVMTPGGWQQAVRVKDGTIAAVGSTAAARKGAAKDATVIDLQGKAVLPGLHDMHVHPLMAGTALVSCRFEQGATPEQILSTVTGCVAGKQPGEWITGGQWQAISFGNTEPSREMLDKVAPANPVLLSDISGHSAWANSEALRLAGITRDTPDPKGGRIERTTAGEPTGVLRESAMALVRAKIPPATLEQNKAAMMRAVDEMLSYGITAYTDALVTIDSLGVYDSLQSEGRLSQRIRLCYTYGNTWNDGSKFDQMIADRQRYTRGRTKFDCVKVFEDGVPTESKTAALLEPYPHAHGEEPTRGMLLVPPAELNPLVTRLDKMGITVKFHAAGDWAARTAIDAIAAARQANGMTGPTHDAGHLTFLHPDDMKRAKALNATLEFSPYLWFPSPINDDIIKASGEERVKRVWPVREGLNSGALVVAGSDWSVVPSVNPWIGIETLVTRKAPNGERPDEVYGGAEAITLKEAMDIFTINAARQMGTADTTGTIEKGKAADLIVVERSPFDVPVDQIHKTVVEQVYIGGDKVFDKSAK